MLKTVHEFFFYFSFCRKVRSLGRPRSSGQRERQEDAETSHDIQQFAAPAVEPTVPKDAVPGAAGTGGASCQLGSDADAGKFDELKESEKKEERNAFIQGTKDTNKNQKIYSASRP